MHPEPGIRKAAGNPRVPGPETRVDLPARGDDRHAKTLRWTSFRSRLWRPDAAFLLNRVRLPQPDLSSPGYHRHDFAELFWVVGGRGWHRHAGGRSPLRAGEAAFLRPEHAHEVIGSEREPLEFINLAFPTGEFALLEEAFPAVARRFWRRSPLPEQTALAAGVADWLGAEARVLAAGAHDRVALFHFLLGLFGRLRPEAESPFSPVAPAWLRDAYARFREPRHFARGVRGLADLCHRTPETVSRVVRRETGESASALVNRLRMEHAAHELRISGRTILDILFECGFSGTSQFYRRFQEAHGMSPAAYRKQFSRIA